MLPPSSPVSRLRGVGPALAGDLARAGIERVADLIWLLPIGYDEPASALGVGVALTRAAERPRLAVRGRVRSAGYAFLRRRRATRIVIEGDGGEKLTLWWFFAARGLLERAPVGSEVVAVGRLSPQKSGGGALMAHPDLLSVDRAEIRPRYPRAGVGPARVAQLVAAALAASEPFEIVPDFVRSREGFAPLAPLISELHAPSVLPAPERVRAAQEQLAWGEAFSNVLARRLREEALGKQPAAPLPEAPAALSALGAELGFSFTGAQARAIAEIARDLDSIRPMRRLLLGDVGSGKTAVALAAIAQTIAAGERAIVLAPTLVLADQYRVAAAPLERALDCTVEALSSATAKPTRARLERELAAGRIDLLIGTHALFDEHLELGDPALVVVDEQQRFGVAQRRAITSKAGRAPHQLTLTATPIPRTLALALRGELDTSELSELPAGRQPVVTERVRRSEFRERVSPELERTIERSEGAFVVCPRIGGDDEEDGAGAIERHAQLSAELGAERVGLAHGRLAPRTLRQTIERFRKGELAVLVGTTVVEVGIDVPHATLMVVDGAESFGLSELHQLRGRVGRSERASKCLLVHDEPLSSVAEARLAALVELASGAEIARRDLALRGSGELGGTRQSGESEGFHLEAFADAPWLERIEADVSAILERDPSLESHTGLGLFALRALSRATLREQAA